MKAHATLKSVKPQADLAAGPAKAQAPLPLRDSQTPRTPHPGSSASGIVAFQLRDLLVLSWGHGGLND